MTRDVLEGDRGYLDACPGGTAMNCFILPSSRAVPEYGRTGRPHRGERAPPHHTHAPKAIRNNHGIHDRRLTSLHARCAGAEAAGTYPSRHVVTWCLAVAGPGSVSHHPSVRTPSVEWEGPHDVGSGGGGDTCRAVCILERERRASPRASSTGAVVRTRPCATAKPSVRKESKPIVGF